MQLVTPSVVMMAVSMLMMSCKMNFHVFPLAILSNAKMQICKFAKLCLD